MELDIDPDRTPTILVNEVDEKLFNNNSEHDNSDSNNKDLRK